MSNNDRKRSRNPGRRTRTQSQGGDNNEDSPIDQTLNNEFQNFEDEDQIDEAELEAQVDLEDNGEDLFGSDLENDYQRNDALDRYDEEGLDNQVYADMDIGERRRIEQLMDARDGRVNRGPGAVLNNDEDNAPLDPTRRRHRNRLQASEFLDDQNAIDLNIDMDELNNISGKEIGDYLNIESVRNSVKQRFTMFLTNFVDSNNQRKYLVAIQDLGSSNQESLVIDYHDLVKEHAILAYYLISSPKSILPLFDQVVFDKLMELYPNFDKIHSEVHVRFANCHTNTSLRNLRYQHLNMFIKVTGVVNRRSNVLPQLKYVKYQCVKCLMILGPFYQEPNSTMEVKVSNCTNCSSKGPFNFCSEQTVYRNYQKITLQETPGTVPAGRLPRYREVILLWDLVDTVRPGEEITVTGIYQNNWDVSLNNKHGFPVFSTSIEANHIQHSRQLDQDVDAESTQERAAQIEQLSKDPNVARRIINSIAPSIFGHFDLKTAIALALFGGTSKVVNGKHHIRGDINVLLIGDPGCAKSQFLKYTEKTAHRCVYTTGQGASAVGLTASVHKDPSTKEWTLEGGALVLADQGVCLIDEFDKMNEKDRTSIHEAMEQQSISISKAGIVTSLRARCSVIAAANPIRGTYNPTLPLIQNVDLTEPILSRFDCICVVRDLIDPTLDAQLANFVLDSHQQSHPDMKLDVDSVSLDQSANDDGYSEFNLEPIDQQLLRRYLQYARDNIRPQLHELDKEKLSSLYVELREEAHRAGGMAMTVRHLESIIRMSQAHAKMHLRDQVLHSDLDLAIATFLRHFVAGQKLSVKRTLTQKFSRYLYKDRDDYQRLTKLLNKMARDSVQLFGLRSIRNRQASSQPTDADADAEKEIRIPTEEFEAKARQMNIYDVTRFLSSNQLTKLGYKIIEESITSNDPTLPPNNNSLGTRRFLTKTLTLDLNEL